MNIELLNFQNMPQSKIKNTKFDECFSSQMKTKNHLKNKNLSNKNHFNDSVDFLISDDRNNRIFKITRICNYLIYKLI